MSDDDSKPGEDLRQGLSLVLRALRKASRQVDVAKVDKTLDKAIGQVSRVVGTVGRAVADELNRIASSPPPWAAGESKTPPGSAESRPSNEEEEGAVHASGAQAAESREPEPSGKVDNKGGG